MYRGNRIWDGELPHAWNKVKIDGEWQIVDSTNNDNELIFNASPQSARRCGG